LGFKLYLFSEIAVDNTFSKGFDIFVKLDNQDIGGSHCSKGSIFRHCAITGKLKRFKMGLFFKIGAMSTNSLFLPHKVMCQCVTLEVAFRYLALCDT